MNDLSIVVEMDNAALLDWQEIAETVGALEKQVCEWKSSDRQSVELVVVQAGSEEDNIKLEQQFKSHFPDLASVADTKFFAVAGGRYYDLKNEGIKHASGDIIILIDSDTKAQPGWLQRLIEPFSNSEIQVVNGVTYLRYDSFLSRVFALYWIFPLKKNDMRKSEKRALNANNSAFRQKWIKENPFPECSGFKVACGLLWNKVLKDNVPFVRVEAFVEHLPPRGIKFFIWRALIAGRDQDIRYTFFKTGNKFKRTKHAFSRFFTRFFETIRRTISLYQEVGFSVWQAPIALLIWTIFSIVFFVGQLVHVFWPSIYKDQSVPDFVKVS